jgi:hypothetical protein
MTEPALNTQNSEWLHATLHHGRGIQPLPGLAADDTQITISVDHIVAVTDHLYSGDDGDQCCCTNLLLATGQWITVCGEPGTFAALLGF